MQTRRRVLMTAGGALLAGALPSAAAVDDEAADLLLTNKVPGASLAAMERGEVVWSATFGKRYAGGLPVTENTMFQAASLSKTINALTVLALVRDGQIDLDAPVNTQLRSWQLTGPNADSVTPSHLLSHTGATTVHGFAGYLSGDRLPSLDDILNGSWPANSDAVVNTGRPGRQVVYSGGGVTVLQKLVEDVTGGSYAAIVKALVLMPLGMANSLMDLPAGGGELADAHLNDGRSAAPHIYPELAAAGLWTTPLDLCRVLAAIMAAHTGDDGALLPRDLARRMLKPVREDSALGTFVNGNRFTHSGVNFGFRAVYVGNVSSRSGYAIMSNGENGEAVNDGLANLIRRELGW